MAARGSVVPAQDNPETENVKLFPKVKALDKLVLAEGPPVMQVPYTTPIPPPTITLLPSPLSSAYGIRNTLCIA
jgi:hypothetical protein